MNQSLNTLSLDTHRLALQNVFREQYSLLFRYIVVSKNKEVP